MSDVNQQGGGPPEHEFVSLRTKLIVFIGLIIIVICSALSSYFIHQRVDFMNKALLNTGSILAQIWPTTAGILCFSKICRASTS